MKTGEVIEIEEVEYPDVPDSPADLPVEEPATTPREPIAVPSQ